MSEELAYIAGLIDGEGYIGVLHTTIQYQLRVVVEMTDKEVIDYLDEIYKGSRYFRPALSPRKARYIWMLFGENAINFLDKIYPYLRVKKKIVDEIRKADWISFKKVRSFTSEELNIREEVYQIVKRLNKRGFETD